ncbi:MAG: DNA-packaging protein [Chloroflexi bacterium]|nr:DNA-packaging protein [Chloroflexota bacterium]
MPILETKSHLSLRSRVARLPREQRRRWLRRNPIAARAIEHRSWAAVRRPAQHARYDLDWWVRMWCTGRRWGKSRSGAEAVTEAIEELGVREGIAAGRTWRETRAINGRGLERTGRHLGAHMVGQEVRYANGAVVHLLSADRPESFRGWGIDDDEGGGGVGVAWADEVATWGTGERRREGEDPEDDSWTQLKFAVSAWPQRIIVTTTPRPSDRIREIAADPDALVTFGHTRENAINLAPRYLELLERAYGGTRLAEQELAGRILAAVEGTMFKREWIDFARISREDAPNLEEYDLVVTAVDPAGSTKPDSDFTGIVTVGLQGDELYVIYSTRMRTTPEGWALEAARQLARYGSRVIICERNFGGDMVASTIRNLDPALPVQEVVASRGKFVRAEPLSLLYEGNRVHHVGYHHVELEDELVQFTPRSRRDDTLDALVYAAEYLRPSGSAFLVASTGGFGIDDGPDW